MDLSVNIFSRFIHCSFLIAALSLIACKSTGNPEVKYDTNVTVAQTALSPRGQKHPPITLAQNGQALYSILVSAFPTTQDEKAADDLQKYLKQITGADFSLIHESPILPKRLFLSVGNTKLFQSNIKKTHDLKIEGYAIDFKSGHLFLTGGNRRGPINAVLAFLEEDLGCRWYAARDPKAIEIPHLPTLTFAPVSRVVQPAFSGRDLFYWQVFNTPWLYHNRVHNTRWFVPGMKYREEWGGNIDYAQKWIHHTFVSLIPPEKYGDTHPQYFSLLNGKRQVRKSQLCLTNADMKKIALRKVLEVLRDNPDAELLHISQNDGGGLTCQCEHCTALNAKEGSRAGTMIHFVNELADGIKSQHPDVRLVTFAYKETRTPPLHVRPRENVVVEICTDMHWARKYQPISEDPKAADLIAGWKKIGAHIFIWDYTIDFSRFLLPLPNMEVVSENLQYYRDVGVEGMMLQGAYQSKGRGAERAPMRTWVWSKLLWNPDLDTRALMNDFIQGYYKESAVPIQAYNDILWKKRKQYRREQPDNHRLMTPLDEDLIRRSKPLFAQARSLARNPEVIERVEIASLPIQYLSLLKPPKKEAQINAFETEIRAFKASCDKHDVYRLNERPGTNGGLEDFVMKSRILAKNPLEQKTRSANIRLNELDIRLPTHYKKLNPLIVEDPLGLNGFAIKQPAATRGWTIQWKIDTSLLSPKTEYLIRVAARDEENDQPVNLDRNGKPAPAFKAGVYNHTTKRRECRKYPGLDEVKSDRYTVFEIGKFTPKANQVLYFAPFNNNRTVNIFIDYIEFVPVH